MLCVLELALAWGVGSEMAPLGAGGIELQRLGAFASPLQDIC